MSVKSTNTLTRKEAEKLYFDNFMKIQEEEIKIKVNLMLSMFNNDTLETFLEEQAEKLGDSLTNYSIINN